MTSGRIDFRKNSTWTLLQTALANNAMLVELAFINVDKAFECGRRLSGVQSRSELYDAVTNNTRDLFEVLWEQLEVLSMSVPLETEDMKLTFWD